MSNSFSRSVGITGISSAFSQGLTLLLFVIIARYLGPSDMGLYAIIAIVIAYANIVGEFSGAAYLIHSQKLDAALINSVFTLNLIIVGLLLTPLPITACTIKRR